MSLSIKAFTLVELIVVITILAILGTISFVSFQGYNESARNSVRIDGVGKIATVVENQKINGLNLLAYANGGSEVPNAQIGGTGAIIGTDYKAGDINPQALNIQQEQFVDPSNAVPYKIGVTTRKGGQYQVATTLQEGSIEIAKVVGVYTQRLQQPISGNGTLNQTTYTLSNYDDVGKIMQGDIVNGVGIPSGTIITDISSDSITLTLSNVLTANTTSLQLGSNEVTGLIVGQGITTPVVDNSSTAVPYKLLVSTTSPSSFTTYVCATDLTQAEVDELNLLVGGAPKTITQWCSETVLSLNGKNLTSIPSGAFKLTSLNTLFLANNQLTSLPPEIGNLVALVDLRLPTNQLTSLPPEIGNLVALGYLQLSGNQLTSLPPEIGNLVALDTLQLGNNQLTSLPSTIGNLTALVFLYLNSNQLTSLPSTIGNLVALQQLILNYNQLTSLPPEIGNLAALQSLRLIVNQLTNLPLNITNLSTLTSLDLRFNPGLGSISASFSQGTAYQQTGINFFGPGQDLVITATADPSPATISISL